MQGRWASSPGPRERTSRPSTGPNRRIQGGRRRGAAGQFLRPECDLAGQRPRKVGDTTVPSAGESRCRCLWVSPAGNSAAAVRAHRGRARSPPTDRPTDGSCWRRLEGAPPALCTAWPLTGFRHRCRLAGCGPIFQRWTRHCSYHSNMWGVDQMQFVLIKTI